MADNAADDLIRCIYCRERRAPSREHALQRAIGGDLIARLVCEPCNNGFSGIDGALAERSLITLDRVAFTRPEKFHAAIGGDHFHFDEDAGLWCDVAVVNEVRAILFPQVHLVRTELGERALDIIASDRESVERFFSFVADKIASGTLRQMFIKRGPAAHCTTPRLTMHRDPPLTYHNRADGYVRVPDSGGEEELFVTLERDWTSAVARHRAARERGEVQQTYVQNPEVMLHMRVRLDDVFRAIAKTAFNVAAVKLGPEFVLREEFHDVRDYIRGLKIEHPPVGPGQLLVDGRFVTMCKHGTRAMVPTDQHMVTICYERGTLYAWITLYGHASFVVRLARVKLDSPVTFAHEFSIDRTGNRALTEEDLFERLWQRDLRERSDSESSAHKVEDGAQS